ncbi:MAG: hypothetical protein BZ138_08120 [Methanosphaera sp. rholeuAM270]|nr:MAG: hypothetical protein BZ138_08120 [Methanosphaera sp. rholeuAM270]
MTLTEETKKEIVGRIDSVDEWDKITTEFEGINIIKVPSTENKSKVFVELNIYNDSGAGKKGIYIKSLNELKQLRKIVTNPLVGDLTEFVDKNYNNNNKGPLKLERKE